MLPDEESLDDELPEEGGCCAGGGRRCRSSEADPPPANGLNSCSTCRCELAAELTRGFGLRMMPAAFSSDASGTEWVDANERVGVALTSCNGGLNTAPERSAVCTDRSRSTGLWL